MNKMGRAIKGESKGRDFIEANIGYARNYALHKPRQFKR